ncbi:hypothetical protein A2954_03210 [Candidatus Roizmanbacteria bacterium RIFCSPLOWO2_01_FULL_37_12]|uniref:Mn transporter n=1 Tax=Candidatus Roizmanbacteria bacterium RIFCSPLOWO2_01_FULL_37_12 TaxID=1802056 RepID=A0A1F7IAL5_9BACT|nr:MAG: hypothetical protein A2954_03210 [Candidatus Roizmanbacteria bacterium RIFCSPLOWO2_01_FULL_37_12]
MRLIWAKYKYKLLIFLSVLGPSVITTMAGNDGGGVITYSLAGAKLGYSALFILPFLILLYAISQEMGSRLAIVTGKGLGDLVREGYGIKIASFVFILILLANFGTLLTNIAALKISGEMLNLPVIPLMIGAIVMSFLLLTKSSYEKSQKIFLTGMIFYFAYVFSAVKGNPDWVESVKSLVIPKLNFFSKESFLINMAVLGTTITPWGQFFVQSYMKDKKVLIENLGFAKIESYFGAFIAIFFTFFIMLATAATLYVHNVPLESGEQAAQAIRPFAGEFASILFGIGLLNAAIIGMVIVSLSSAYAFTEFFGFSGSLDEPFNKSKTFYRIFLINNIIAALLVITPFFPLFKIVLYTQSLNAILLPVFFYYILKIINNKELMGVNTNTKFYNILAYGAAILIVVASIITVLVGILS